MMVARVGGGCEGGVGGGVGCDQCGAASAARARRPRFLRGGAGGAAAGVVTGKGDSVSTHPVLSHPVRQGGVCYAILV